MNLYENLKKSKNNNKPHPALKYLYDIHIGKLSNMLGCSHTNLISILNGNRTVGDRLSKDLMELAIKIDEDRKIFYSDK